MTLPFDFPQKVLFKHCDPAGIVFYPRYFEMINDCTEAFFDEALGYPFHTMMADGGVPTRVINAEFLAPSRHGDTLILALSVRRLGKSALDLAITGTCGDEQRLTSRLTLVHTGPKGRPQNWPDNVRARMTPYLGEPECRTS